MNRRLTNTAALWLAVLIFGPAQAQTVSTLSDDFDAAGGVSVGPDGNIYVANFGDFLSNANGTTVYRITPEGVRTVFATGFNGASGHAWNSQDVLFQSNIAGNRIDQVTLAGQRSVFTSVGISGPVGVAIDSSDNVFVANCGNNTIRRITPQGSSTQFAASALFNCPNGLTIDDNDNLYTANFGNGNVLKITPQGVVSLLATTPASSFRPGGGNGHLTFANGVLYVASNASSQIFEVTLDGQMRLIAGDGSRGHQDGPAEQASFSFPNGIAASADGRRLYLNESVSTQGVVLNGNTFPLTPNRVRVIELQAAGIDINPGLNGSWFNAATSGQGIFIDVFPDIPLVFMAWFTYDTSQAPDGSEAVIGDPNHRWVTAQGPFEGDTANLQITLTTGGLFDDPATTGNTTVGTIALSFQDCSNGTLGYNFTDAGLSGNIPLTRIANDNVGLCEQIVSGEL